MLITNPVVFILLFLGVGLAGMGYFHLSKNAKMKRRLFPWFMVFLGALFLLWAGLAGWPTRDWKSFLFILAGIAIVTIINIRLFTFCNSCGATLTGATPFTKARYCAKCGKPLITKSSAKDNSESAV